jgi:hypothetical protein
VETGRCGTSTHVRNGQRRKELHHETHLFPPWPITFLRPLPNACEEKRWKSDSSSTEGRFVSLFPLRRRSRIDGGGPMNGAQENRDPARWAACQKGPTGSTSYELLSTGHDDCLRRSLGAMMEMLSSSQTPRVRELGRIMGKTCRVHASGGFDTCYSLQLVVELVVSSHLMHRAIHAHT